MVPFCVNDTLGLRWKHSIPSMYTIPSLSSVIGAAVLNTSNYGEAIPNMAIITDSAVFSITGPENHYDNLVLVYVIRNSTALHN